MILVMEKSLSTKTKLLAYKNSVGDEQMKTHWADEEMEILIAERMQMLHDAIEGNDIQSAERHFLALERLMKVRRDE